MNLQQFITTEFGTRLWMSLGRWLPPRMGLGLAHVLAGIVSRRRHASIYRILYDNQAGVRGIDTPTETLHRAVRQVFNHVGQTAYDLMHSLALGQEGLRQAVTFDQQVWEDVQRAIATGRGVMICGCHTSNFNVGFLTLALRDETPTIQVLSPPAPAGGFRLMHDLRTSGKLQETPINSDVLRTALRRLREGGIVATGVDWPPAAASDDWLPFFGRRAHLPTGHIRLALSTDAVLLPVACRWDEAAGYRLLSAPHLELELTGDRRRDIQHNARRVLTVMERWIAERPEQWLMYYPVWPSEPAPDISGDTV
jgi:lauroyl/myristoyl acyltransferase